MSRETVAFRLHPELAAGYSDKMSGIRVRMQKDGLLHARAEVGTAVYITQGPPIDQQRDVRDGRLEPAQTPKCVGLEVELNVRFASMQSRSDPR